MMLVKITNINMVAPGLRKEINWLTILSQEYLIILMDHIGIGNHF